MNLEQVNLGYSLKNIPIPTNNQYLKYLIIKVESFIRRIRWRVFFCDSDDKAEHLEYNTYGFKTENCPPQSSDLNAFEDALYNLVHTIKFKRRPNSFQAKLAEDMKQITNSNTMLISADKTTNLFKIEVNNYKKLITDSITSAYRKADASAAMNINREAKEIAEKLRSSIE